ncbi:GGDEF domain-containing protein [Clostridium bowmanii]|uniref:tetratricopeptide repeat-containing diguanylate cyclase n=1 Tax=Clostridium bowmanii TaxID=132925 RepID=UPI001C0D26BE|nr:tetratricopeptide repeat-containing diguanylate cyclase [Clostridium bowmanii]MBU3188354.1 GGDEF domain-containing protein [Clostridium bowmanii]MCA1072742.1 GGDEF domain-containing protein [Clostridium bowmanii]
MVKEELVILQKKVGMLRVEGKYKEAIENCYELIENGKQLKDYKALLVAYMNLAASYYCIGDMEATFNSIESHKQICDKHGDAEDILGSYNVLFLLYDYNKDLDMAKKTLDKSIALGKKLNKYNIISNAYANYSHIYQLEEDYEQALEMANMGLEMAKLHKPVTPILELRVKLNIAKALIELGNFEVSKSLIEEMINDSILDSFIREKTQCYHLQGVFYYKQQLYVKAFESFSQSKILVESYKDLYLLKDIQKQRSKLAELMGDINLAYNIQKEYIALLSDISKSELELVAIKLQIKHSMTLMEKKANTDYLTGIYNRSYMETTVNGFLKQAHKDNERIICMVFDLDGFKSINDEYGHLFGDEVIKQVSEACSSMLRENDIFARFGGDEFVIILKGMTLENGEKKAEQILNIVRNLNILNDGKRIPITISIGITDNLTCAAMYFNELFNVADLRLYKAKNSGRNCVCAVN